MLTCCLPLRLTSLSCLALLLLADHARAQQPRLPRADASVSAGWLHSDVSALGNNSDNWASRRATITGEAGFYWTEHLKTEFVAERSSSQDVWQGEDVRMADGQTAFRFSEHRVQDTRVSIGQFYQFGHNAWTHVLLGGGVSLTRRGVVSDVSPLVRYDRNTQVTLEPDSTRSSTETRANAFAAAALKAYVTPRVFVRSDMLTDLRVSLEAVVLRVGIGVDF